MELMLLYNTVVSLADNWHQVSLIYLEGYLVPPASFPVPTYVFPSSWSSSKSVFTSIKLLDVVAIHENYTV